MCAGSNLQRRATCRIIAEFIPARMSSDIYLNALCFALDVHATSKVVPHDLSYVLRTHYHPG
jgi:hypothetical protein